MKAVHYESFRGAITLEDISFPRLPSDGVIIKVEASGLCRSDWHGWMGHDTDIHLPHVPGHEFAGVVEAVGKDVKNWQKGDRVTVPFSVGCGRCPVCQSGNQQICDYYFQPGFTAWGSFAEYVAIPHADFNLVRLPEEMTFATAALLGCRFITSYRGIVAQGKLQPGQWVSVFGCGGVGLSAIMIATALGARVIAVDIRDDKLEFAQRVGAQYLLNATQEDRVPEAVKGLSQGGVHLSVDALGSSETCIHSILSLRKRGKHIQIGLMMDQDSHPPIPMAPLIANELQIIGSHGMQAHRYPELLALITAGTLSVDQLIGRRITLDEVPAALQRMGSFPGIGVTLVG